MYKTAIRRGDDVLVKVEGTDIVVSENMAAAEWSWDGYEVLESRSQFRWKSKDVAHAIDELVKKCNTKGRRGRSAEKCIIVAQDSIGDLSSLVNMEQVHQKKASYLHNSMRGASSRRIKSVEVEEQVSKLRSLNAKEMKSNDGMRDIREENVHKLLLEIDSIVNQFGAEAQEAYEVSLA